MQEWSNIQNPFNAFHYISRLKKKYNHLNRCQKCIGLNLISIPDLFWRVGLPWHDLISNDDTVKVF